MQVKQDRSLLTYILLAIVTCGIYVWYFDYTVARDVDKMNPETEAQAKSPVTYVLLRFVTCGIYGYYWRYRVGNRLAENAPKYGLTFTETGTTILLWDVIGLLLCGLGPFFAANILIKNSNAMAAVHNSGVVGGGYATAGGQVSPAGAQQAVPINVQTAVAPTPQLEATRSDSPAQSDAGATANRDRTAKFCTSCGASIRPGCSFCTKCGTPVAKD